VLFESLAETSRKKKVPDKGLESLRALTHRLDMTVSAVHFDVCVNLLIRVPIQRIQAHSRQR
jgi:hypothetical protein